MLSFAIFVHTVHSLSVPFYFQRTASIFNSTVQYMQLSIIQQFILSWAFFSLSRPVLCSVDFSQAGFFEFIAAQAEIPNGKEDAVRIALCIECSPAVQEVSGSKRNILRCSMQRM
jgi:hypothetical protein